MARISGRMHSWLALGMALLVVATPVVAGNGARTTPDRVEPGLQGEQIASDKPGSVLPVPYSKGVMVIGHDPIEGRDSSVQLVWVDHCAYASSTAGPFPLIGTMTGDPALTGVAVIDVSDPRRPRTVRRLRDKGSIAAVETISAVTGDLDYLLRIVVRDLRAYSHLMNTELLGHGDVASVRTSVVLDRIKHTTALPIAE